MQLQDWARRSIVQPRVLFVAATIFFAVACQTASAESALSTTISPLPGYSAHGTATLRATPSGNQFMITVAMQGLSPGAHPEHIHAGTCPKSGAIVYSLPTLHAGSDGTASATATIDATLSSIADGKHSVNVHQPDLTPVACGTIPAEGRLSKVAASARDLRSGIGYSDRRPGSLARR